MKRRLPLWLLVLLGASIVLVCGYYLLGDWAALNRAFMHFEVTVRQGADLKTLFVADAYQNTLRLNCFADGVGVLLGAVLAAIGVHGLCSTAPQQKP